MYRIGKIFFRLLPRGRNFASCDTQPSYHQGFQIGLSPPDWALAFDGRPAGGDSSLSCLKS
jgi:hypothetical protein